LLSNNFQLTVLSSFCSCSMETWCLMLSQSQSQRWMTNLLRLLWLTASTTLFSTLAKMVSSSHFHGCLSNMYPIAQYDYISGYNQIWVKFALNLFYDFMLDMTFSSQYCSSFMLLGVAIAGSWPRSWRKLQSQCKTTKTSSLQRW
jgi:hypothetical protein